MAHLQKFTRGSASRIIGHCERELSAHGDFLKYRTGSEIDRDKSHLNMSVNIKDGLTAHERLDKRLNEVYVLNRNDVNVMCDWVITYPEGLPKNQKDLKEFFGHTIHFLKERYGVENRISCNIHLDENQPHLHYCFVPVTYDSKKERYKVSAKEVINRADLNSFHGDLEEYLHDKIGLKKGLIYSGKTELQGGNKSVSELKSDLNVIKSTISRKKQELIVLSGAHEEVRRIKNKAFPEAKKMPLGYYYSKEQFEELKTTFSQLKERAEQGVGIIAKQHAKIEDLEEKVNNLQLNVTELADRNKQLKKSHLYLENRNLRQEIKSIEKNREEEEVRKEFEKKTKFNKETYYEKKIQDLTRKIKKQENLIEKICNYTHLTKNEFTKLQNSLNSQKSKGYEKIR